MDTRIVAAGFVAAAVGIFFLHRWMLRRANAQYAREVAALHDRIRVKAAAREQAERAALAQGIVKRNEQRTIPVGDPRHPASNPTDWAARRMAQDAEKRKMFGVQAPARRPVSAYDARKAEVRHRHEDATPPPGTAAWASYEQDAWRRNNAPAPDAPSVSGGGGSFDGGGASGDWSSSSSDSGSSSDGGSSSSGSD